MDVQQIVIHSDSQLVVRQVEEEYAAKDDKMALHMMKVHSLLRKFVVAKLIQVPREANVRANALAELATTAHQDLLGRVPIEILSKPSIQPDEDQAIPIQETTSWMDPVISFLQDGSCQYCYVM